MPTLITPELQPWEQEILTSLHKHVDDYIEAVKEATKNESPEMRMIALLSILND